MQTSASQSLIRALIAAMMALALGFGSLALVGCSGGSGSQPAASGSAAAAADSSQASSAATDAADDSEDEQDNCYGDDLPAKK